MEAEKPMSPAVGNDFRDVAQKVIVIDLFAGIGGLERALELAQLQPWFTVAVESDPDCRRCLRRRFPGMEFCSDIKKIDRNQVQGWLKKIPDANGVIVGGAAHAKGCHDSLWTGATLRTLAASCFMMQSVS